MRKSLIVLFCILALQAQESNVFNSSDLELNKKDNVEQLEKEVLQPGVMKQGAQEEGQVQILQTKGGERPEKNTASSLDNKIMELKKEIRGLGVVPIDIKKIEQEKSKIPYNKNGLFVGIHEGVGGIANRYEDGKYNQENNVEGAVNTGVLKNFTTTSQLLLFGGKLGYQNFFNRYFGTRIYGDMLLGTGSMEANGKIVGSNIYLLGGLNLDMLMDVSITKQVELGWFLGFGFGVMLLSDQSKNANFLFINADTTGKNLLWKYLLQVDYMVNHGISVTLFKRHRIEVGVKIPVSQLLLGLEKPASYSYLPGTDSNQNPTQEKVSKTLMSDDISFWRSSFFIIGYNYLF